MDSISGSHRPRKQMGRNDQDATRQNRQFHKEPLEFHHEEKERRDDGTTLMYHFYLL